MCAKKSWNSVTFKFNAEFFKSTIPNKKKEDKFNYSKLPLTEYLTFEMNFDIDPLFKLVG